MKNAGKKPVNFFCRLCGSTHGGFVPGAKGRNQRLCPVCGAKGRQRTAWLALDEIVQGLPQGAGVLHCAPERSFEPKLRDVPHISLLTCDLETPGVDLRLNLTACPFPDAAFALVICNHVLEHVHQDVQALAEMARILRPGGLLFLTVPVHRGDATRFLPEEQGRPLESFSPQEHVRYYGWDLADAFQRVGLDTKIVNKAKEFPIEERERQGLKNEFVFLGRKR